MPCGYIGATRGAVWRRVVFLLFFFFFFKFIFGSEATVGILSIMRNTQTVTRNENIPKVCISTGKGVKF